MLTSNSTHQDFKVTSDKSLLVASFMAVVLFLVLFAVVQIINNRNSRYTETSSQAREIQLPQADIYELENFENEASQLETELQSEVLLLEPPELDVELNY